MVVPLSIVDSFSGYSSRATVIQNPHGHPIKSKAQSEQLDGVFPQYLAFVFF
jgi:hypothetical protein